MSTRIAGIDRIVIAIAIQIQTVDGFGVKVGGIVGADEAAPFGRVIPGITVIQTGVISTTIAPGAKMGAFECTILTFLFYHFSRPPSRKSLPGRNDLGGCT